MWTKMSHYSLGMYISLRHTPLFIVTQFMTAKLWNQPICPSTEGWIKKSKCSSKPQGTILAIKMNTIVDIWKWI